MRLMWSVPIVVLWTVACAAGDPVPEAPPAEAPGSEVPSAEPERERRGSGKAKGDRGTADRCRIAAYVADPDPQGLNVRADPSAAAEVIGVLPLEDPPINVVLSDADGGWFQLSEAKHFEGDSTDGLPQQGWVSGTLLRLAARNYGAESEYMLHARPDRASPVVADPGEDNLPLVECKGRWVQVEHEGKRGWLEPDGQCASAVTNCS